VTDDKLAVIKQLLTAINRHPGHVVTRDPTRWYSTV